MSGKRFSESSSSSSSGSHDSNRRQRHDDEKGSGSSCGIRSVNEYQDKLINKDGKEEETAEAYVEAGDKSKAWAGAKATDHKSGHFSADAEAGAALLVQDNHTVHRARADAGAEVGVGGAIAEANADATVYSYQDDVAQIDVAKGHVGGGVGIGPGGAKAKVEAGIDVVDLNLKFSENQGVDASLGLNVDTGFEAGVDGVSASVAGLGVSLGRKTGISTPIGELNVKLW